MTFASSAVISVDDRRWLHIGGDGVDDGYTAQPGAAGANPRGPQQHRPKRQ